MSLTNLRFFKSSLFETSLFIAGKDEPVYKQLIGYHQKIEAMDLGTRSPLFFNEQKQYITISFKGVKTPLEEQKKYDVQVIFKEVKKEVEEFDVISFFMYFKLCKTGGRGQVYKCGNKWMMKLFPLTGFCLSYD